MGGLIFGSTSSAGPNPGGLDMSQSGGGGAGQLYTNPSGGMGGMAGAAMFMPALTGILGAWGAGEDIKAQSKATIKDIKNRGQKLMWSQDNKLQQIKDLDRVFSDKLTASGLEALKAEGRLKAASAETGTRADTGSTGTAIAQAEVNRLHRDAMILRTADVKKANTLQEMVGERMNFEYGLDVMTSGQSSNTGLWLNALNQTGSSMMAGLNFMNDSQKAEFFQTNTTGMETA